MYMWAVIKVHAFSFKNKLLRRQKLFIIPVEIKKSIVYYAFYLNCLICNLSEVIKQHQKTKKKHWTVLEACNEKWQLSLPHGPVLLESGL